MSTAVPEAPAPPFEFFDLHVVRTARLGPTMLRITFGGEPLRGFAGGGRDQSFSLFLPHPGQPAPVLPTGAGADWFAHWRAMDPGIRAIMRSYTVREQRRTPHQEVDVDFALHGDGGPASRWATRARPGDRVTLLGPVTGTNKCVGFQPPPATDWVLLSGDETALPAIASILEWLPADLPAKVWLEVPHHEDVQPLPGDVTWLVRDASPGRRRTEVAVGSVRSAGFPSGTPYAWIAGESGTVRALRRHLVSERGFDRKAVKFAGYWRLGSAEEQLLEETMAGVARVAED